MTGRRAPVPAVRLAEAVPLAYALLTRAAQAAGIRALAIKGPVATAQGLRPEMSSVDVDVLVEPRSLPRMQELLDDLGWRDDGFYDTPGIVPRHSVTHRHPTWPCEVDVHHWFPGFLADPGEVFDVLWRRRTTVTIAHVALTAPDPVGHAALEALNHLKDATSPYRQRRLEQLAASIEATWPSAQLAELAVLAADTGASETLRPFLDRLGEPVRPPTRSSVVPLTDWALRSGSQTQEVLPWLVGLGRVPWWRRPGYVSRAVWLRDDRFRALQEQRHGSTTRIALLRARWERLRRGVRRLPQAVRELRRIRGR